MKVLAGIVFAVVLALGVGGSYLWTHYNERTLECTVTEKDRGFNPETNSSEYRVYTTCGTFSNEDSWWRLKFNSGDLQGELEEGRAFKLTVAGPRIPFFSAFPNIFDVEPA